MTSHADDDGDVTVSQRAIEAVAAERGTPPTDLEPLYSVADPDALDALFPADSSTAGGGGHVAFDFEGCRVRIFQDGTVETSLVGSDGQQIGGGGSTAATGGTGDGPD